MLRYKSIKIYEDAHIKLKTLSKITGNSICDIVRDLVDKKESDNVNEIKKVADIDIKIEVLKKCKAMFIKKIL